MSQDTPNTLLPPFQSSSQTLPPPQWQQPPDPDQQYREFKQGQQPFPQYPQYQSRLPDPPKPPKKLHKLLRNEWFWIAVGSFVALSVIVSALSGGMTSTTPPTSDATQPAQNTQPVQQAQPTQAQPTVAPTQVPTAQDTQPVQQAQPTQAQPTVAPTQVPTVSPAQLEAVYKASTTSTTVATLDKDGNVDQGKDVHFTATILNFVKDDSGNTAGANVDDPNTSGVIQVAFPSGTDLSQLNTGDTLEVWGTDAGVSSGPNAFGATVQEVGIAALYMTDQTTGYHAG
jgi:cytoskeletal protein RodZ